MRRLNTLLDATPELKTLAARARQIHALQKIWETVAPSPLNSHSHIGLPQNGHLTVYTSSSAVAAKLNMQTPTLLKKLQKQGVEVTSIRVEVQVTPKIRVPARPARRISPNAAKNVLQLVETLPDSPLQKALQRLAKHLKRQSR